MRELSTIQKREKLNKVFAVDEKGNGGLGRLSMAKYRKKPVVVEAVQFFDNTDCICELSDFMGSVKVSYENKPQVLIETLEGTMAANEGDYIIKGVNGEFYPCKPDIFKKTYEAVL